VTNYDELATAVDATDEYGGIDIVVNNAGLVGPRKPITEVEKEEYSRLMSINLDAVFFGSKIASEKMIKRGEGGSILNISSTQAFLGTSEATAYTASKGGVTSLTYSLAAELGEYGIRANSLQLGLVETAMSSDDLPIVGSEAAESIIEATPLGRIATPRDVGNAAVLLASDLASYVTAESFVLDGGMMNTL